MSLDYTNNIMTNLNKLLDDVREDLCYHFYQGIKLARFEIAKESTRVLYTETISNTTTAMEGRFNDISTSTLFKNIICLLDISTWPMNDIAGFGIDRVNDIAEHFSEVLIHSKCNVQELQNEWTFKDLCQAYMYQNNRNEKYVKLWERIFINEEVLKECKNILHIFELLLITPFSNAKLERMFSRMLRVKNDWRNRLGRDRLETLLRISGGKCFKKWVWSQYDIVTCRSRKKNIKIFK